MIEIIDLSKKYGNNAILENVSCSLENQRIYALVGGLDAKRRLLEVIPE